MLGVKHQKNTETTREKCTEGRRIENGREKQGPKTATGIIYGWWTAGPAGMVNTGHAAAQQKKHTIK